MIAVFLQLTWIALGVLLLTGISLFPFKFTKPIEIVEEIEPDINEVTFEKADNELTEAWIQLLPVWQRQIDSSINQSTSAIDELVKRFMKITDDISLAVSITGGPNGQTSSLDVVQQSSEAIKIELEYFF